MDATMPMNDEMFTSLATHLQGLGIDNFRLDADGLRIGSARWRAAWCDCGENGCDGWRLTPARDVGHDL